MTQPEDERGKSISALIRKFRAGQTVGFNATITPDASGAVADMLTLAEARRTAAEATVETNKARIEAQDRLIRQLWAVGPVALIVGFLLGASLP
jgi:hypothetical protein